MSLSPRIWDRDAYFFHDNWWWSTDLPGASGCPGFGTGECDPAHPVYTSTVGGQPWDFENTWQMRPGELPTLRDNPPVE